MKNMLSADGFEKRQMIYDEIMRILKKSTLPIKDRHFIVSMLEHKLREQLKKEDEERKNGRR